MKNIFSYISKLNVFRPWNIIVFSTPTLLLALMFFSKRKGHFLLNSAKEQNEITKAMKDRSRILFRRLQKDKTSVLFANYDVCKKKVQLMMDGGQELLQVISDFDRTMSRYMIDGRLNLTCHGIIESYPDMSTNMKGEHATLRDQYYPIEVDQTLTNDEKIPYMVEWWTKAHDVMVNSRINSAVFDETVKKSSLTLRIDCDKFMRTLNAANVPLLIFSAGIGNVIDTLLKQRSLLFDNVRIVSNFMNFDKEGTLVGFQDSVIHSFNKYARSIQDSEFYENICTRRRNVLLLGDSTGDPHMADGLAEDANVVKIGFLNSNVDALKDKYLAIYDIVLLVDETFGVPQMILEAVLDLSP